MILGEGSRELLLRERETIMTNLPKAIGICAFLAFYGISSAQFLIHNFRSMNPTFSGLSGWVNEEYSPGYAYDFSFDSDPAIGTTYSSEIGPEFGRSIEVNCGTVPDTITGVQYCGVAFVMPFTAAENRATDISQ